LRTIQTRERCSRAPRASHDGLEGNGRMQTANDTEQRRDEPCHAEHRRHADLVARYRRTRSLALRNQLIEWHRGQVEAIARRIAVRVPRSVDVQDLVHAGIWGLMQALESFDPRRGTPFTAFMRLRAHGAMLDELRHMDYLPRLFRQRQRALASAQLRLSERLGRDPSDAELAQELGVTESNLRRRFCLLRAGADRRVPAEDGDAEDGPGRDGVDALTDEQSEPPLESLHRRELLEHIERTLQPIEWSVLRMHYLEGLSGKDVARKLRLSAARICQIHVRVLERLKGRLAASNG
jgi:RNA polymerase sigma factor for flagellar operon FliA